MDPSAFDTLTRSLVTTGTRRRLLGLLATLPLTGLLASQLSEEVDAGGRRKRRRKRNTRRSGDDKKNRKGKRKRQGQQDRSAPGPLSPPAPPAPVAPPAPGCTPTTCAAQGKNCGTIADGCGNQLRCGPDACGDGYTCTDNVCRCANENAVCQGDCCQSGQVCQNGDGACCTESTCPAGANCGTVPNICGGTISCGGICTAPRTCGGGGTPNQCGCLTALACCADPADCRARCCSGLVGQGVNTCGGEFYCAFAAPDRGTCASTNDCLNRSECRNGTCCGVSGVPVPSFDCALCCNGCQEGTLRCA